MVVYGMSLQQLRYLIALDEHRHFGHAAAASHVAQPTLTTQLRKLEEELGVQLFDRSAHPVEPTPIGERIVAQAHSVLSEVNVLEGLVRHETAELTGTFTIGIIPTLAPYLLPLFISSFAAGHPEVHLEIRELESERIIAELLAGRLDFGLLVTPLEERQLREINLFYEPFLVFASPTEPIHRHASLLPTHLHHEDLWILEQGHCFRNQVLNICGAQPTAADRNFSFQAGSIETLKNMVRRNPGYTMIPEMSVHPTLDRAFVKRFADPQPAREVSLVVHRNFSRERLVRKLADSIHAAVPPSLRRPERYLGIDWR